MPSLQTIIIFIALAFSIGLGVGGIGVYKWKQAAEVSQMDAAIKADNKAMIAINDRASSAEKSLEDDKENREKIDANREKDREKNPAKCVPDSATVDFLLRATTAPKSLPR